MKYLTSIFFLIAVVAAVFSSIRNMEPIVVLGSKISLAAAIIFFLVSLVTTLVKDNVKATPH